MIASGLMAAGGGIDGHASPLPEIEVPPGLASWKDRCRDQRAN